MDKNTEEKVLKELVKTRNVLKRKFQSIKLGESQTSEKLKDRFKPITEPLKELIDISKDGKISKTIKDEIKNEMTNFSNLAFNQLPLKFETSTPKKETTTPKNLDKSFDSKNKSLEITNDDADNFYSQGETIDNESSNTTINPIDLSHLGRRNELDTLYGPHKDSNGEWKFGNSSVKLNDDKIVIGSQSWLLTPGLYELMFHIKPKNYDKTELEIYKKILLETNAHKRDYKSDGQIKGTKAYKYKNILSKLFKNEKTGRGLMKFNDTKPNYVYWDDPNELVDRLRLLISSFTAGHNNHNNEIVSIIEELRENGIIV